MDDIIDLGNNYVYIQDTPKTILYRGSEGLRKVIIPPTVLSYKFDEQYIIAKLHKVHELTGQRVDLFFTLFTL